MARQPCQGCGGPKPTGRGLRYCTTCDRKPTWRWGQAPCHACGSTENKQPKKQYCDECLELRRWRSATLRAARKLKVRKPCENCGGRKAAGTGQRWCESCRAKRAQLPLCRCKVARVRARGMKLCEACHLAAEDLRREKGAARSRRAYAANREKLRARKLREYYRRKTEGDPRRRANELELRRLRYRLRRQREGLTTREPKTVLRSPDSWLPGRPLAAMLDHLASFSDLAAVCGNAGVGERQVTRWRRGEQGVSTEDADRALTGLDLLWWDVWTEDTVRVPLFEVHVYAWQVKTMHAHRRTYRLHLRAIPYGDVGADRAKIAEIAALMSGEAVAA